MSEVDSALGSGPVVLELFTTTCQYCAQQEQILKSLSTQYPGVTFLKVNAYTSGFGGQFNAQRGVPQLHVYVKKSGSSYVYIGPNGQTSTDPMASSIIGLTGASTLSGLIDAAIAAR